MRERSVELLCSFATQKLNTSFSFLAGGVACQAKAADRQKTYICAGYSKYPI